MVGSMERMFQYDWIGVTNITVFVFIAASERVSQSGVIQIFSTILLNTATLVCVQESNVNAATAGTETSPH
jgi:hypothetical protein